MKKLTKVTKYATASLLILLASTMLLVAFSLSAYAQDQEQYPPTVPNPYNPPTPAPESQQKAIVVVVASVGGTTNPQAGTYTYNYGDTITLTATPSTGFQFAYWAISGLYLPGHNVPPINTPEQAAADPNWVPTFPNPSQVEQDSLTTSTNPLTIICGYGYTYQYQPVFTSTAAPVPGNDSIVIVLSGAGGTTDPLPGKYSYDPNVPVTLAATPNSGFEFQYWIATGSVAGHDAILTDQSLSITCQQGYTYTYQPVFKPSAATLPSTGVDPTIFYVIIVVLVIVAVVAVAFALMRGKK
jgi:hypothetical protein